MGIKKSASWRIYDVMFIFVLADFLAPSEIERSPRFSPTKNQPTRSWIVMIPMVKTGFGNHNTNIISKPSTFRFHEGCTLKGATLKGKLCFNDLIH